MGDKQPSVRTLDSGERVTHYPSGEQVLVPTTTGVDRINALQQELHDAHTELQAAQLAAVDAKRAAMASGDAVAADKRSV